MRVRDFSLTGKDPFVVAELVRVWKVWEGEFRFVQNLTISATGFTVSRAGIQTGIGPGLRQAKPPAELEY